MVLLPLRLARQGVHLGLGAVARTLVRRRPHEGAPAALPAPIKQPFPSATPRPRPAGERIRVLDASGTLHVSPSVIAAISATVGALEPETGGILGLKDGEVSRFRFDETSACTGATYAPDITVANEERRALERDGAVFCGFVHSHPGSYGVPSAPDRRYAQRILENARVDDLVLPIVIPGDGGVGCRINWYVARRGLADEAEIIPVRTEGSTHQLSGQFDRVKGAYDTDWLGRCRVVSIGCGGAREALEDLARIGIGQFVLIDPDRVTASNLATQAVYRRELGRPKVLACADAIREINPDAAVVAVERTVQDIVPDQLEILLGGRWAGVGAPVRAIVGTWTDDHAANAYGHRAALEAGLPVVSASLHAHGASGEVIVAYPGRTRGCVRCATKSRYDHYLAGGDNAATSAGAPFWATPRLNALKMCVTVAALHALEAGERSEASAERIAQSALFDKIVERPLAIMRLSPDARDLSGVDIHDRVLAGCEQPDRLLFDETVWREVSPVQGCPDCGGSDRLRPAGRRTSTRRMLFEARRAR